MVRQTVFVAALAMMAGGSLMAQAPAPAQPAALPWELFALDIELDLTADATRTDVLKAIDGHILGKGVLVGRFKRPAQP